MSKSGAAQKAFVNPKTGRVSITEAFGVQLAKLLSEKISEVHSDFDTKSFCQAVKSGVAGKTYTQRVEVIAGCLRDFLPESYPQALSVLVDIMGPENPEETGMFTQFYWLMPVGKFIEKYGLNHFRISIQAIEELTKRNTGEYAIRPFARTYPDKTLSVCRRWAQSNNFHLRRLASEGLRPKLPWAPKLDVWIDDPAPVFEILESLKADEVRFVQRSVANHVRDWLKVNPQEAKRLIGRWTKSRCPATQWILRHAQR